jgi:hypothetical protein
MRAICATEARSAAGMSSHGQESKPSSDRSPTAPMSATPSLATAIKARIQFSELRARSRFRAAARPVVVHGFSFNVLELRRSEMFSQFKMPGESRRNTGLNLCWIKGKRPVWWYVVLTTTTSSRDR